jgi:uncharacterized protein DUF4349
MRGFMILTLLGIFLVAGCGQAPDGVASNQYAQSRLTSADQTAEPANGAKGELLPGGAGGKPEKAEAAPLNDTLKRKIVYTARVELSVEKFEKAEQELKTLIKELGAHVETSDDGGAPGAPRFGTYTIRVPADNFEQFMDEVVGLGELRKRTRDARDISNQYYDLETRNKNDKAREQSMMELLKVLTAEKAKAEERAQVNRELWDIRERIEQNQTRLRRFDNDVAYSTVTVVLTQRKDYEIGSATFGTTIARTWEGSVGALLSFGKGLVLLVVALTPWIPVVGGLILAFYLAKQALRRNRETNRPPPSAPPQMPPTVLPV